MNVKKIIAVESFEPLHGIIVQWYNQREDSEGDVGKNNRENYRGELSFL